MLELGALTTSAVENPHKLVNCPHTRIPNCSLKRLYLKPSEKNVFPSALKNLHSSGKDVQLNIKCYNKDTDDRWIILPESLRDVLKS